MLESCYISATIADDAGIVRVASLEGRALVGRKDGGDYSGIVFSYRWPGDTYAYLHRLRLDHPPLEGGKTKYRYLTAPETRNRLYLPPCDPRLLDNLNLPLIITEGEKKALALWRMAIDTKNGSGDPAFLPIGLPGVYGWRGTIGSQTDSHGERVQEKGPIPDLNRIGWLNRKVTIKRPHPKPQESGKTRESYAGEGYKTSSRHGTSSMNIRRTRKLRPTRWAAPRPDQKVKPTASALTMNLAQRGSYFGDSLGCCYANTFPT